MSGLPADFLESPLLVDFREQIDRRLAEEQAARKLFRNRAGDGSREEFINGEVVEKVPAQRKHFKARLRLESMIHGWAESRRLGSVGAEQALTAFPRNDYCPDICFWSPERLPIDGDGDRTVFPPPDFVAEILSPSTAKRDRGIKYLDYEAHGVKEYWIVDADQEMIEQYLEREGKYQCVFSGSSGILKSEAIRGFEMPVEAAFDDEVHAAQMKKIYAE